MKVIFRELNKKPEVVDMLDKNALIKFLGGDYAVHSDEWIFDMVVLTPVNYDMDDFYNGLIVVAAVENVSTDGLILKDATKQQILNVMTHLDYLDRFREEATSESNN